MKYEAGDKILVLHSNEEGEVVEIINDKMVLIEVAKLRFPVYMDQIDFPYFKRFSERKIVDKKKDKKFIDDIKKDKSTAKYKVGKGVWLSFLPIFDKDIFNDDIVESFKLYLINQTDKGYNFDYHFQHANVTTFTLKNQVQPLSDFYLHDIDFEFMNDSPRFEFEFSLIDKNKLKAEYFEALLKIRAKQLFKKIEEIKVNNEPTFSYELFLEYPDKVNENKPDFTKLSGAGFKIYDASKARENIEAARSVVDLHIEKLTESWKHLSNFEILTLQLKAFEKYYQLAVIHYQPSITIIHGIGTGKLRESIHEILKLKKEVSTFVNQYHPNFGYGATEIYFKY